MKIASRAGAVALATAVLVAVAGGDALAKVQLPAYSGPIVPGRYRRSGPDRSSTRATAPGSWPGGALAAAIRSSAACAGRLRHPTEGRAFGADWVNNCVPFCAAGTGRSTVSGEHQGVPPALAVGPPDLHPDAGELHGQAPPRRVHDRVQIWTVEDSHGQYFWNFAF